MESSHFFTPEEKVFMYRGLYKNYKMLFDEHKEAPTEKTQYVVLRKLETSTEESKIYGKDTGLMTEEALERYIQVKKKLMTMIDARLSKEHPVTYRNISKYCLEQDVILSADQFFKSWFDNLVIVRTTREQNEMLKDFQKDFIFPRDCWKEMYEKAGLKLVKKPDFRRVDVCDYYGVERCN